MQVKHSMKKPTGLAFGAVTTLGIVLLVLAVARQASDLPAGLSGDLGLGNAGLSLAGLGLGISPGAWVGSERLRQWQSHCFYVHPLRHPKT